jgi:hypothetical protein
VAAEQLCSATPIRSSATRDPDCSAADEAPRGPDDLVARRFPRTSHKSCSQAPIVLNTDVQASDASIDHQLLLQRLAVYITDPQVLHLIAPSVHRCAERGGL